MLKKNLFKWVAFVSLALLAAVPLKFYAGDPGVLTGKITDHSNGKVLAGVEVSLEGSYLTAKTNVKGVYKLDHIMPGTYTVTAKLGGYTKVTKKGVAVASGKTTTLDFKMKPEVLETEDEISGLVKSEEKASLSIMGMGAGAAKSKKMSGDMYYAAEPAVDWNTEEYDQINENIFLTAKQNPLSTFSIDVDGASYANTRRFIRNGQMPYKDAVRIEEFINYFDYRYADAKGEHPFSVYTEVSDAPWNSKHKMVHIGIQGKKLNYEDMRPSNLVFLVDVSGSMSDVNKLPLLKSAFKLLLNNLDPKDRIAIVAYAGAAGLVCPSTPVSEKEKILSSLENLSSGGSTAGGAGVRLAYKVAKENLMKDGNNRVILATDGDFNVGVSSTSELVDLIEEKRDDGIFLTICGFGMGNYKDGRMEQLSNAGNGNYYYIDTIDEAKKVFVREMRATLFTIAKDVKIQIEFNPTKVQAYRLIGYENRMLKSEDFNDDKKDAGELGAGHTVTALYEIIPVGVESEFIKDVDPLKYQKTDQTPKSGSDELLTLKFRYKRPKEDKSRLITTVIKDEGVKVSESSDNFRFSAAVAEFGMLLRDSEFKGGSSYADVIKMAEGSKGKDVDGIRAEFIELVKTVSMLAQ